MGLSLLSGWTFRRKVPETNNVCVDTKPPTLKKERSLSLHRPYELSEEENKSKPSSPSTSSVSNVISTLSQSEAMHLIYSNTFQKSPLLSNFKFSYSDSKYDWTRQEELRTLSTNGFHDTKRGFVNGRHSPPPLEKIARRPVANDDVFVDSPTLKNARTFEYSWDGPEKMYDSPNYDLKTSYNQYEDFAKQLVKYNAYEAAAIRARSSSYHNEGSPKPPTSSSAADDDKHLIRSPSKARMKYTPLRELQYYRETMRNYPEFSTAPVAPGNKSPTSFSLSNNAEERKPYYRGSPSQETELLRSMNLHSAAASTYDLDHLKTMKIDYEKYRRYSESFKDANHNVSSAFSVIRPHFHRMYSTESGYSSDPSNNKLFKPYQSEILTRRNLNLKTEKRSPEPSFREHNHDSNGSIEQQIPVSKLHVSDEASKEALKAFDAHVEKMMAENQLRNRGSQSVMLKLRDGTPPKNHAVQCTTIDSTHKPAQTDLTHGVGGLLGLTRIANEHLGQAIAKEKKRSKNNNCLHLWQFLRAVLEEERDKPNRCIEWTNRERGEFRLIKTAVIADLWGQSKNRKCMTYEKMARAMRYYYKMKILEKVPHKRLHFRFGEKMLSRVLDTNTVKPFRRMSTGDPTSAIRANKAFYSGGPPPPLQMLRRSSVDGINSPGVIFPTRLSQSDCPPTPMTPLTPLTPCTPMTPLTPCTPGVNRTPVICSRTTNVFFPPDVPLPNEKIARNSPPRNANTPSEVTERDNKSRNSTPDTSSGKNNEGTDSASMSSSDSELIVDIN